MSAKSQHHNILFAVLGFIAVIAIVAAIGYFTFDMEEEIIQGEVEVSEHRVSSKVSGRILELRVQEGDFVHKGDTLAIIDAPEVRAKKVQVIDSQMKAAQSQYDMARKEERKATSAQVNQASGTTMEVSSYTNKTVQVAQMDGEVSKVYSKVGELVGTGSPIMSIAVINDLWGTFNVHEDFLQSIKIGDEFTAYSPAFDKEIVMKVFYIKDLSSDPTWKANKSSGQYDLKTFEVKARPAKTFEGLRPGMSLIIQR